MNTTKMTGLLPSKKIPQIATNKVQGKVILFIVGWHINHEIQRLLQQLASYGADIILLHFANLNRKQLQQTRQLVANEGQYCFFMLIKPIALMQGEKLLTKVKERFDSFDIFINLVPEKFPVSQMMERSSSMSANARVSNLLVTVIKELAHKNKENYDKNNHII